MKILQINAVYKFKSTGRTCFELHNYLEKTGIECVTVYGEDKADFKDALYLGNLFDHKIHALLSRITGKIGYYSYFPTRWLLNYIQVYKPDVVHLRNLHSNYINIPILLKYLSDNDIPTVVNLHDCFWFTGQCCHYTLNKCYKWKRICDDCKYLGDWNKVWFFDRTKKMQSDKRKYFSAMKKIAVIGVSQWVTKAAMQSNIFKNVSNISCIYNWVDLNTFKPNSSNVKAIHHVEEKFMILCVSSVFDVAKGLDEMFQVAKRLPEDCVMVLVGNLDKNISRVFPNNMIIVNEIYDVKMLAAYYSAADVFLQLSKEETGSKVMMEAISCGTPIVVYNSTCGAEYCEGGCGHYVNNIGDIDEIISKILLIRESGKKKYSENCIIKAKECFNQNINCDKIIKIYEDLVNK